MSKGYSDLASPHGRKPIEMNTYVCKIIYFTNWEFLVLKHILFSNISVTKETKCRVPFLKGL